MTKISVAIATFNEEANIRDCLKSVEGLASEIVVVDGSSTDATVAIAKSFGARVEVTDNPPIFHINKQKAIDMAKFPWILQLDADERVSKTLGEEIKKVVEMDETELEQYESNLPKRGLFLRHQRIIEKRDGAIGDEAGEYVAFFVPRLNYFLGGYLRYGGVYPDGVIRFFRRGKAWLPCKDVHEQMHVEGRVGWLKNDLYHVDSPTFKRYLQRNSRYIDLLTGELREEKVKKNFGRFVLYMFWKPVVWFLTTLIRHKGILDGARGVVFSFFSALRFPRAYWRYISK